MNTGATRKLTDAPEEPGFAPQVTLNGRTVAADRNGSGISIGVIDSGWDRSVLDQRVHAGIGMVDPEDELRYWLSTDDADRLGHGTACANLILDLAPSAAIVPIRVFGRRLETSPDVLARAIGWAVEQSLKVVNLSLGTQRTDALRCLYSACDQARRAGMIIVAAAGGPAGTWSYPAVFEPVIGVGAALVDDPYTIAYEDGAAVECRARTRRRRVRGLAGTEFDASGTSFAAPVVTGIIARLLETEPSLDVDGVRERLRQASRRS